MPLCHNLNGREELKFCNNKTYYEYQIQKGDTLIEICTKYGHKNWRTVYDDSINLDFRKCFPNPNMIDYAKSPPFYIPVFVDEITPIAQYIVNEMNSNTHGPDVHKMSGLNRFSANACIADYVKLPWWRQLLGAMGPRECMDIEFSSRQAAILFWAYKVGQNQDWDHKPKISRRFHPRVPNGSQEWHLYGNTLYYYDVWSNIHYGYVGRAAGFSDSILLDGAGLEQIGSTLLRFKMPKKDSKVKGLRAWDGPSDRAGIKIGIKLYQMTPNKVMAQNVISLVTNSAIITKKYYKP